MNMDTVDVTPVDGGTLQKIASFHGHMCPGLAIGIKAAEIALAEIGPHSTDEEVVALVETDMCGVDAIQFLIGCTFGKGNLIHLDHGKSVFTFARRSDGKTVRLSARASVWGSRPPEVEALFAKVRAGAATHEERERLWSLQRDRSNDILERQPEDIFDVRYVDIDIPRVARIMQSVECESCGEAAMETRIRLLHGRKLCRPCFEREDAGHTQVTPPSIKA